MHASSSQAHRSRWHRTADAEASSPAAACSKEIVRKGKALLPCTSSAGTGTDASVARGAEAFTACLLASPLLADGLRPFLLFPCVAVAATAAGAGAAAGSLATA